MGEEQKEPGTDQTSELESPELRNQSINHAPGFFEKLANFLRTPRGRAATAVAIGATAFGADKAIQNNRNATPSIVANTPTLTSGTTETAPSMPKVIATPQQTLEKIEFVVNGKLSPNELPSDPIEVGRQLIEAAQEANSPTRSEYGVPLLVGNRGAVAIQAKNDFTIYQWPKGSKNFTPADPSNNGNAEAHTIRAGQAVYVNNFVELVTYTDPSRAEGARDEPVYILATLPGSDKVFFISPALLEQDGDATINFLSPGGGRITKGDASVDNGHSFRMGNLSDVSKMQVAEDNNALNALIKQNGFEPVKQPHDSPPPPTGPLP